MSYSDLCIGDSFSQGLDVAITFLFLAVSCGGAIAFKKNCVEMSHIDLSIGDSFSQAWDVALTLFVCTNNYALTIL